MKKVFLLATITFLLMSGCQYTLILLPTPSVPNEEITNTPEGKETVLPAKTITSPASATQTSTITQTSTSFPTATQTPVPLMIQPGSPAYIENFAHIDAGCNWLGIAGQIFDANNKPISNLVINVKGVLELTEIDKITLTGIPEANIYGPGGYEIERANKGINSENSLKIQIFDINGNNLSNALSFSTFSNCEKNLIIINFLMN